MQQILFEKKDGDNSEIETLIQKAIKEEKCVRLMRYKSSNGGTVCDRIVEVFEYYKEHCIVRGFDVEKKALRSFKLSRMEGLCVLNDKKWENKESHKKGKIDALGFNSVGSTVIYVKILMNVFAYNILVEEFPATKECFSCDVDGDYILELYLYNDLSLDSLARFCVSWFDKIKKIEGEQLKNRIAEITSAIVDALS